MSATPIQTKLEVGPAGDRYEQEADRVAASVMRRIQSQPTINRSFDTRSLDSEGASRRNARSNRLLKCA